MAVIPPHVIICRISEIHYCGGVITNALTFSKVDFVMFRRVFVIQYVHEYYSTTPRLLLCSFEPCQ
jgi:hypothetical protein